MLSFNSKYSTLEDMLKDRPYCKWLMKQPWFLHRREYAAVVEKLRICRCGSVLNEHVEYGEVFDSCNRTWCHSDRSCCFKTAIKYKYKCPDCGFKQ